MVNVNQFLKYYKDAFNAVDNVTDGHKYRDIELLGNSAAQIAINQMQTEAQKAESELAYKRSSAPNQVNLMRAAGMSRAGAINALNGGGSYTPAPISLGSPTIGTDAGNVRQKDLSAIDSALSSFSANVAQMAQLQEQKRQFNIQHAEEKRQFDITHAENKRMNDDALLTSGEQRRLLGVEIDGKTIENQLQGIMRDIEQQLYDEGVTYDAERHKRIAEKAAAILNDFRDKRVYDVIKDMSDAELESLFQLQGIMNTLTRITNYDAPKVINDVYKYAKKALKNFF